MAEKELQIEAADRNLTQPFDDIRPKGSSEQEGQQKGNNHNLQNGKQLICAEKIVKAAENQKILKQTVQNINADGVFSEPTKEGLFLRAKDKQTKEHEQDGCHPKHTKQRCKGIQMAAQLGIGRKTEEEYPEIFLYPTPEGNNQKCRKKKEGRKKSFACWMIENFRKLLLSDVIAEQEEGQKIEGAGKA